MPRGAREERLPPRPGAGETLVYASLERGGCEGCFEIAGAEETADSLVVDIAGGIHGSCEMLIVLGACALVPRTDKPAAFRFAGVECRR
jgi:hypothetical protein